MNSIAIFWLILYVSWITVEFITKEYNMKHNIRIILLTICSPILACMMAISCSGDKEEEPKISHEEDFTIKYKHTVDYNDSVRAMWQEHWDEQNAKRVIIKELMTYKPDSSKIIAIAYPDDAFTDFQEAFMVARSELGAGKHFVWLNKMYSTNYKEEGYPNE